VSFAAITLCVASQRIVGYFVIDSVWLHHRTNETIKYNHQYGPAEGCRTHRKFETFSLDAPRSYVSTGAVTAMSKPYSVRVFLTVVWVN
jgi:hypothetical protein